MEEMLDYTERLTRAALAELPDGEWSFTDWIDDDGIDFGVPIPLTVTLRKLGDRMVADWTGTSPQVKGAINNTLSFTRAATYTCLKSVLPHEILCNAGFYRPIEVIAPPGTIANSVPPAACAARGLTGFRMIDTVFGALAQMLPDRVIAASEGGNTGVSIGGYHADRTPFIFVEFICSAWGGRPWADGLDGNANLFANMSLPSAEVTETEQPLEILCTRAHPGRRRARQAPRRHVHPPGLPAHGGRGRAAGARRPSHLSAVRALRWDAGQAVAQPADLGRQRARADGQGDHDADAPGRRLHPRPAGARGLGRSAGARARRVLRDVLNELVSPESARDDYGVVIDAGGGRREAPRRAGAPSCGPRGAGRRRRL